MGTSIKCKHCGTEFMILSSLDFMGQFDCENGFCHVETERSIRCPQCMKRLNNTEEEFNDQIVGQLVWD